MYAMITSRLAWLLPLAALSLAQQCDAGVIINVGGTGMSGPAVEAFQYVQQSWTQTQAYTNVDVSVFLYSWTASVPFHVSAFLTTNTGPVATPPALATTTFTGVTPDTAAQDFSLFTGLSLGPGTYYLTLSGTDSVGLTPGAIWVQENAPPTLDTGITLPGPGFANNSGVGTLNIAYPPASTFGPSATFRQPLAFTVTGDTPEPTTVTMMLSAIASLFVVGLRHRNRRNQR